MTVNSIKSIKSLSRRALGPTLLNSAIVVSTTTKANASAKNSLQKTVPNAPNYKQSSALSVSPSTRLQFPRDYGAHLDYRTEWWYFTAIVSSAEGIKMGLQLTFFRSRTGFGTDSNVTLSPAQITFAHVALSLIPIKTLYHDQRASRLVQGLAVLSEADTRCQLGDWILQRNDADVYSAQANCLASTPEKAFRLAIKIQAQSLHLQGRDGFSQKGPNIEQASHYYSRPQLRVSGLIDPPRTAREELRRTGITTSAKPWIVNGLGWFDHEWSSTLLDPQAQGWDWIGMNLLDGSTLIAFQLRRKKDGSALWSHACLRDPSGTTIFSESGERAVVFTPIKPWRSLVSNGQYPVHQRIQFANRLFEVRALFENQEIDARRSTGGFYWEGACDLIELGFRDSSTRNAGSGYLEMTGYAGALRL